MFFLVDILASLLALMLPVALLLSGDIRERRSLRIPCSSPADSLRAIQRAWKRVDHLKPAWIQD